MPKVRKPKKYSRDKATATTEATRLSAFDSMKAVLNTSEGRKRAIGEHHVGTFWLTGPLKKDRMPDESMSGGVTVFLKKYKPILVEFRKKLERESKPKKCTVTIAEVLGDSKEVAPAVHYTSILIDFDKRRIEQFDPAISNETFRIYDGKNAQLAAERLTQELEKLSGKDDKGYTLWWNYEMIKPTVSIQNHISDTFCQTWTADFERHAINQKDAILEHYENLRTGKHHFKPGDPVGPLSYLKNTLNYALTSLYDMISEPENYKEAQRDYNHTCLSSKHMNFKSSVMALNSDDLGLPDPGIPTPRPSFTSRRRSTPVVTPSTTPDPTSVTTTTTTSPDPMITT